jgi:hypothetical protein
MFVPVQMSDWASSVIKPEPFPPEAQTVSISLWTLLGAVASKLVK